MPAAIEFNTNIHRTARYAKFASILAEIVQGRVWNNLRTMALVCTLNRGTIMSPELQDTAQLHNTGGEASYVPAKKRVPYLVLGRDGLFFILFSGEEFGPYNSEREATLFAIDAAHKLGEQGEDTQVVVMDLSGNAVPQWTFGADPYPPGI